MAVSAGSGSPLQTETPTPGSLEKARRHNGLAGKLTKLRGTGIFKKGPKWWGQYFKANKIGHMNPEVQSRGGKIGGKITGPLNAELKRGICAPGASSKGGKRAAETHRKRGTGFYDPRIRALGLEARLRAFHRKWHVARKIVKRGCKFC
jgi:hypothetical protein